VTGPEKYVHHYEPETKRQSQQWLPQGAHAPAIKRLSTKKVMAIIFWDHLGVLLVRYFRIGAAMTGKAYAKILGQLKEAIQRKREASGKTELFFYMTTLHLTLQKVQIRQWKT